jgi:hypothetical protein
MRAVVARRLSDRQGPVSNNLGAAFCTKVSTISQLQTAPRQSRSILDAYNNRVAASSRSSRTPTVKMP